MMPLKEMETSMLHYREFRLRKRRSSLHMNLTSQTVRRRWVSTFNFPVILTLDKSALPVWLLFTCPRWEPNTMKVTTVSGIYSYIQIAVSGPLEFHFDFFVRPRSHSLPYMPHNRLI